MSILKRRLVAPPPTDVSQPRHVLLQGSSVPGSQCAIYILPSFAIFNMLASNLLPTLVAYWPILLFLTLSIHLLRNRYHNNLHKYPGPPLAAYTNWWRFFNTLSRRTQEDHIRLHRQHGDIVRLGPNCLSFADPSAINWNVGYVVVCTWSWASSLTESVAGRMMRRGRLRRSRR